MTTVLDEFVMAQGWTELPFRAIARKVSDSGFPQLESLSVFLDAGVVPRSSREDNHNELGESLDKYQRVIPNDLVFNKLRTWQGGFGISEFEGIVSPAYIIARPDQSLIEPRFLGYLLKSKPYLAELTRLSKWMPPTQFDISWESIREIKLRIPTLDEQRRISDYLDAQMSVLQSVIQAKLQVQKLLTVASQAEFTDIFGHPYFSVQNLNATRRLGPCLLANDGGVWGDEPTGNSNYLVLRSTEISQRGYWRELENAAYRKLEENEARKSRLMVDDIVVTKASGSPDHIGKAAITTQEIADLKPSFGNFMQRIRVNPTIYLPAYLHFFLKSFNARSQFNYLGTTSTGLLNVSAELLNNLRLPVVSLENQQQTVAFLKEVETDFDHRLNLVADSIAICHEYRSSLITEAVTGSFDVTTGRKAN